MSERHDLLLEIGTEELPPKALGRLSEALTTQFLEGLDGSGIEHGPATSFATPRRLALRVCEVAVAQPDREVERRGPGVDVAFDAEGQPTRAAKGFAKSCGVEVDQLGRIETDKGAWLAYRAIEAGIDLAGVAAGIVNAALARLPIPRRMRWSDSDVAFVRPVHWVVLLHGNTVLPGEIMGHTPGRDSYGHRFHHPGPIALGSPDEYERLLRDPGHVVADYAARCAQIRKQVDHAADALGGIAVYDDALIEEVGALVEWPVAVSGGFDAQFLELPDPVLISTMRQHQRYFPVRGASGALLAHFITISNIESKRPDSVREGNERVIRPRLADAQFFYRSDLKRPLADYRPALEGVVFQERLGSVHAKTERVARLAAHVAIAMGCEPAEVELARRAGALSKCDLVTAMVGEFPDLQGAMGAVYARASGEDEAVAVAIEEAYQPRFAGDLIPPSRCGQAVAIADRLDTLVGIFGVGLAPTGDRDPYALRRAALGVLRILIEGELDLVLRRLIEDAREGHGDHLDDRDTLTQTVHTFCTDRLRGYFADRGVPTSVFAAVHARAPTRPLDFAMRVRAVDAFRRMPEAESLAAASKRIQNILRQADPAPPDRIDEGCFREDAEWDLAAKLTGLGPGVRRALDGGDYAAAMTTLAGLRDPVDAFFEAVRVMDDDLAVRANRLALLAAIGGLIGETADISRLQEQ